MRTQPADMAPPSGGSEGSASAAEVASRMRTAAASVMAMIEAVPDSVDQVGVAMVVADALVLLRRDAVTELYERDRASDPAASYRTVAVKLGVTRQTVEGTIKGRKLTDRSRRHPVNAAQRAGVAGVMGILSTLDPLIRARLVNENEQASLFEPLFAHRRAVMNAMHDLPPRYSWDEIAKRLDLRDGHHAEAIARDRYRR